MSARPTVVLVDDHRMFRTGVRAELGEAVEVVGEAEDRLRVALTAPPVEGAANDALRRFLAARLGVARGRVTLEAGEKSREKTVRIAGMSESAVREALGLYFAG